MAADGFAGTTVEIIVPVHNGPHVYNPCLESLERTSDTEGVTVTVVDDASDSYCRAQLERFAESWDRVALLRFDENVGFVEACNTAMAASKAEFIVLLNSDTIVPDGWLDRLLRPALTCADIAMVNPLSNNAINLSVPMPPGMDFASMDAEVRRISRRSYPDIVTAVGFCLLLRKSVLEEVGLFDEAFSPGYGEEADLHMRVVEAGWRVVLADDVYVYHAGSATFDRAAIDTTYREHMELFHERWGPTYRRMLRGFERRRPLHYLRRHFGLPRFRMLGRVARHLGLVFLGHPRRAIYRIGLDLKARDSTYPDPPRGLIESWAHAGKPSVTFLLPEIGIHGGVIHVLDLAGELLRLGVGVRVACLRCADRDLLEGRPFEPLVYSTPSRLAATLPDTDIVVCTFWTTTSLFADLKRRGRSVRGVYYLQDYESYFYPEKDPNAQRVVDSYHIVDERVVTSNWLLGLIRARGLDASVVPYGFQPDLFRPRDVSRGPGLRVVAMANTRAPRRGADVLFRALEMAHGRRPDISFVLFGSHELDAKRLPFPFEDHGRVARRAVLPALYAGCDLFIDPSRFQGFGLPGMEAMACGLACVLTNVGGVNTYAEDGKNALMVPPGDAEAICDAVLRLAEDERLRHALGTQARATAERRTLRDEARAWSELLNRVAARGPA